MVPLVLLHARLPQTLDLLKKKKENKQTKSASRKYNKAKCYKMRYACTMEYYSALKVKGTCNVDEL